MFPSNGSVRSCPHCGSAVNASLLTWLVSFFHHLYFRRFQKKLFCSKTFIKTKKISANSVLSNSRLICHPVAFKTISGIFSFFLEVTLLMIAGLEAVPRSFIVIIQLSKANLNFTRSLSAHEATELSLVNCQKPAILFSNLVVRRTSDWKQFSK